MNLLDVVREVRSHLEQNGRVSLRMLQRQFTLDDDALAELIDELVDVQRVARREENALAWVAGAASLESVARVPTPASPRDPRAYTPKHLADKILASRGALEGERKQVTVLFADVKGSLELAEQVDPEQWHAILDRFFAILADGVHRFEGTVNQYTGDGIMALFGAPLAHEDHAQRACYAALHLRDALRRYADELRLSRGLSFAVRMGLNSGEVVVGKIGDDLRMDYTAQGAVVGLAQRMEALAAPGTILLADATSKLVQGYFTLRDLGPASLKSVAAPVRVHELEGPRAQRTRFDVSRARGLSSFVGRGTELATLEAGLERAVAGQGSVIGVVAEPGTGKSRLCFELAERARARGIPVREAQGVPHGKQVPFLPVLALLRGLFGIGERDSDAEARQKIAGALVLLDASFERSLPIWFEFLGVPDAERPAPDLPLEDRDRVVLEGVRRLIRTRSERGPALVLLEDLHWFDAASERVLATLVDAVRETRTLLLVNFRPEFHAEWMQRSGYQQLPLAPLGSEAVAELLRALLGLDPGLAKLAARIAAHAGGNPFFVEELVQALVEDGSLAGAPGAYQAARAVEALALPATVQAVLAARIDRLAEREKQVLQTAAVIGPEFDAGLLARVAGLPETEVMAALRTLAQAELALERSIYPEVVYGFKHPLTQEVALRSQLATRRAERQAAVARAIEETTAPEKLDERAALLAHHWQEAGEKLAAAKWHARAGVWARGRAHREAFAHWSSVRALCDALPDTQEALSLGLAARGELIGTGMVTALPTPEIRRLLDEARGLAARTGDSLTLGQALASFAMHRAVGDIDYNEALSSITEAQQLTDRHGDQFQSRLLMMVRLVVEREGGRLEDATQTAGRVARVLEDIPESMGPSIISAAASARSAIAASSIANRGRLWYLLGRLDEAQRELDAAVEIALRNGNNPVVWLLFLVDLARIRGDAASAAHAARTAAEKGIADSSHDQRTVSAAVGMMHALAGAWSEAAEAFERTRSFGYGSEQARYHLAEAKLELGEHDRAREIASAAAADFARRRMPMHELPAQLVLARVLMRVDGMAARAAIGAALARAESLIADTGARVYAPELYVERGRFAQLLGDEAGRARELREAQRLFDEMGAPLRVAKIERELATLGQSEERA